MDATLGSTLTPEMRRQRGKRKRKRRRELQRRGSETKRWLTPAGRENEKRRREREREREKLRMELCGLEWRAKRDQRQSEYKCVQKENRRVRPDFITGANQVHIL